MEWIMCLLLGRTDLASGLFFSFAALKACGRNSVVKKERIRPYMAAGHGGASCRAPCLAAAAAAPAALAALAVSNLCGLRHIRPPAPTTLAS
jgi:hypothetical protein